MPRALPSQEYLQTCFAYDEDTGVLMWKKRPLEHFSNEHWWHLWLSRYEGKSAGSVRAEKYRSYLRVRLDKKGYYAHRVIWKLQTGNEPAEIDHVSGNGTNNARLNLRAATRVQNAANNPGWNTKRSLPKGVRIMNTVNLRYTARACRNRKTIHLGSFATAEEAHAAYCAFVEKIDGPFFRPSSRKTPKGVC